MNFIFLTLRHPDSRYFTANHIFLIQELCTQYKTKLPDIEDCSNKQNSNIQILLYYPNDTPQQEFEKAVGGLFQRSEFENCEKNFSRSSPYLAVLANRQQNTIQNDFKQLIDDFEGLDENAKCQDIDDEMCIVKINDSNFYSHIAKFMHIKGKYYLEFITQQNYNSCLMSKYFYQGIKCLYEFLKDPTNPTEIQYFTASAQDQQNPPTWIGPYTKIFNLINNNKKAYTYNVVFYIYKKVKEFIQKNIPILTPKQSISSRINPHKNWKNALNQYSKIHNFFDWKLGLDSNIFNQSQFIDNRQGKPNKNPGICSGLCYLVYFLLTHPQNKFNIDLVREKIKLLWKQSIRYQKTAKQFPVYRRYFKPRQKQFILIYGLILQIQKLTQKDSYFQIKPYKNAEELLKDALKQHKNNVIISYQVTPQSGHLVMLVIKDNQFYFLQPNIFNLKELSERYITWYLSEQSKISGLRVHVQPKDLTIKKKCQDKANETNHLLNQLKQM